MFSVGQRNGIQQRLNSWQDGVSGTNCPIEPGKNWTYAFQMKDQIGSFFYFPSINFQKNAGGFGPIRVHNRKVIAVPFEKPEEEFDLLIGDWSYFNYKLARRIFRLQFQGGPIDRLHMLINGKMPFNNPFRYPHESFEVEKEGSYTQQIVLDSLDVHVGQSYSVLVTADRPVSDYYIVATPSQFTPTPNSDLNGVAVLHYRGSTSKPSGPLPTGPSSTHPTFSIDQARCIRSNMTVGAARPNPQGSFNVTKATISQTFILHGSDKVLTSYRHLYAINNVSYLTPTTPLELADYLADGAGVYRLDEFPVNSIKTELVQGTFVASGIHKGWLEIVLVNDLYVYNSWHLDGYGFFVVGFGDGEWSPASRDTYNIVDPIVRSTVQVYPNGWTTVYVYMDNPGMWNLRSQLLHNWYFGQELYVRVLDADTNPAKEKPPPTNLLRCGVFAAPSPTFT
ncbi:hypothetical protein HPP92_012566 [Vanilla planifolia]|uniref:Monocopper oxidase-like protein SKU5 n=1 Tax=Vanilla planifolia TaxID=51239 RepID=A0A835UXN3_VANPL|nr:hypothetical protein HPP92_012566 [Vanilla planifolia]